MGFVADDLNAIGRIIYVETVLGRAKGRQFLLQFGYDFVDVLIGFALD